MTYYLFYQPGHIPGRPGAYNNCRVDIDEEGNVTQSPLPVPPQDMATARQEAQAAQEMPEQTSESPSALAMPPVEPIQEPPEPIQADVPPVEVPPNETAPSTEREQPAELSPPAEMAEG